MSLFLKILGWVLIVGAAANFLITMHVVWQIANGAGVGITVESYIETHLRIVRGLSDFGYAVLPDHFIRWFLSLPALLVFPVRGTITLLLGWWLLSMSRRQAA